MFKLLSETDKKQFHHYYRNSDLFRQWSGILCQLEREIGEMDAVSLWFLAERNLQRLRNLQQYRDEDIPYIYNELIDICRVFVRGTETIERTQDEAERSAITVMCVILTSLMNAVEKGHEDEDFDNKAMCVAIARLLQENKYFNMLMDTFFARKTGNDGLKVVITPSDPMLEKTVLENMDEEAKKDIKQMVANVIDHTQGLKTLFNNYWEVWKLLWKDICSDSEMIQLLKNIEPRGNEWGFNQKMVCNVIGIFKENTIKADVSFNAINNDLCSTNVRSYLSKHAEYNGSNSVFNREQHDFIKKLIEKQVLSINAK